MARGNKETITKSLKLKLDKKDAAFFEDNNIFNNYQKTVNSLMNYIHSENKKFTYKFSAKQIKCDRCKDLIKNKKIKKKSADIALTETVVFDEKKNQHLVKKGYEYYLRSGKKYCKTCFKNELDLSWKYKELVSKKTGDKLYRMLFDAGQWPENWQLRTLLRGALNDACATYKSWLTHIDNRWKERNRLRKEINKHKHLVKIQNRFFQKHKEPKKTKCSACGKLNEISYFSNPKTILQKKDVPEECLCDSCYDNYMDKVRAIRKLRRVKHPSKFSMPIFKATKLNIDRQGAITLHEKGDSYIVSMRNPIKERDSFDIALNLIKKTTYNRRKENPTINDYQLGMIKSLIETNDLEKTRSSIIRQTKRIRGKNTYVYYALLSFRHIQENKLSSKQDWVKYIKKNKKDMVAFILTFDYHNPYADIFAFKDSRLIASLKGQDMMARIPENQKRYLNLYESTLAKFGKKRDRITSILKKKHSFWLCCKKEENKILDACDIPNQYREMFSAIKSAALEPAKIERQKREAERNAKKLTRLGVLRSLQSEFSTYKLKQQDYMTNVSREYVKKYLTADAIPYLFQLNKYALIKFNRAKKKFFSKSKSERRHNEYMSKYLSSAITRNILQFAEKEKIKPGSIAVFARYEKNLAQGVASSGAPKVPFSDIRFRLNNMLAFNDINYLEVTDEYQKMVFCPHCNEMQKETDNPGREHMSLYSLKLKKINSIVCQKCLESFELREAESKNLYTCVANLKVNEK